MVTSIRTLTAIGFGMVISLASPAAVHEPMARPLLMPGKQSLYQRVLARPGAVVSETAVNGSMASRKVIPFSVYYVYARKGVDGTEWVQVGSDSHGTLKGWIRANQLIKWNQALTVAFREPVGRERVLLFRDRESLKKLVDSRDVNTYDHLYRQAEEGKVDGDSPVIAIQPRSYVDIKEDFYLVPIQRHEDVYLGDEQARMLQVTSVPLKENRAPVQESREYRSGLVFVIDSTVSMGPYIDRTKEVVKEVYSSIAGAGLEDKVSFGMVAYRDNVQAAPRLGYLAKTYASLEQGRDAAGFFRRVKSLKPASVSSQDFVEDAYAGVKQAIEEIDWRGNDARYIVLVTDAGARVAKDPLGRTGMDADALRQLAHDKGISIWVLHLLTPEGSEDHSSAASQYQRLSYYPGIGNFYYGVTMGKVAEFGRVLDALASQITEQVGATAAGTPPLPVPDRVKRKEMANVELAALQDKVAKLGYALRMRYLNKAQGEPIPSVFNAWMVDRDYHDPRRATVDVRILLSRDQLSDLQFVLKQVLEMAEEGLLSPRNFLNDLKSLAATMSRDPGKVGGSTRAAGGGGGNLADLGYMREYIEDLPYAGEVMNLSLEDWANWPAKRQFEFINGLESKIHYYQALHDHTDLWISLDGGPVTGDSVFPVALEALP